MAEDRDCQVYVIEIMDRWHYLVAPGLPPGKRCYYVGQTSKDLTVRYKEHRSGRPWALGARPQSAKVFKKIRRKNGGVILRRNVDTILRRSMTEHLGRMTQEESERIEEAFVLKLRLDGHAVYPERVGRHLVPFKSYQENR